MSNTNDDTISTLLSALHDFDRASARSPDRGRDLRDLRRAVTKLATDVTALLDDRAAARWRASRVEDLRGIVGDRAEVTLNELISATGRTEQELDDDLRVLNYEGWTREHRRIYVKRSA